MVGREVRMDIQHGLKSLMAEVIRGRVRVDRGQVGRMV